MVWQPNRVANRVILVSELTPGLSVKDFSLKDGDLVEYGGSELELLGIRIELNTTATVGTRAPAIDLVSTVDKDVYWELSTSLVTPAVSSQLYQWGQASPSIPQGKAQLEYMPRLFMEYAFDLRFFDRNAIDPLDTLIVHLMLRGA